MAHLPVHRLETKTKKRLFPVKWSLVLCILFRVVIKSAQYVEGSPEKNNAQETGAGPFADQYANAVR